MTNPRRAPNLRGEGDQLRRQLVRAAGELLLRPQSLTLPSLRAVARACSVSPAAVYLHFASQQALIEAVLDDQLDSLSTAMRSAVQPDATPPERLHAFAAAYVAWGLEHPGAYQLLFETRDQLPAAGEDLTHDRWDLIEETASLVQDATGADEGAAGRTAFRLWASLHGIVSLRLHKPGFSWPAPLVDDVRSTVDGVLLGHGGAVRRLH